jgi:hypothetical protein
MFGTEDGYDRDLSVFKTLIDAAEEVLYKYATKVDDGMYPTVATGLVMHDLKELFEAAREATMAARRQTTREPRLASNPGC